MIKISANLKNKNGTNVECLRCGKKWLYTGHRHFYIQCPDCRYTFLKKEKGLLTSRLLGGSG